MPPLNRCGSIQTDKEEGLLLNISSFKIDQFKRKTKYHANYVQRVYRKSGLQKVEDLANNIQFKITARHYLYIAREAELTQEMQEWRRKTVNNIVILRESVGEKKRQKLNGVRGIYQIRVKDKMDEQCVMHRNITYACSAGVQSNYDAFLANATWAHKSLNTEAAQEHRNGAINQREAYLDQAAIVHEEQETSRFNAIEVSMNETWERRRQRSVETSKKRGNLTAKLDQARIHQLEAQAGKRSKHKNT
jgi:hypothetical protein